jgi:hypothetical protein
MLPPTDKEKRAVVGGVDGTQTSEYNIDSVSLTHLMGFEYILVVGSLEEVWKWLSSLKRTVVKRQSC